MCGRYALHSNPDVVALQFHLEAVPSFPQRYNISPSAQVLAVKPEGALLLRWGWRGKAHNLRAETAPSRRRCLVPADGFYEWRRVGSGKQPYYVRPARERLFGFAAIWDADTCGILTVAANGALRDIHHRMPAIIAPRDYAAWLGGADGLLAPAPDDHVQAYPVGAEINSGAAESPRLIEPQPSGLPPRGASGSLFGD
ncbi:MAG TPA: SOS response-associated peptidase [Burkholderiales bacterium]|jgi:putative SOS response-associated peptidase YedK